MVACELFALFDEAHRHRLRPFGQVQRPTRDHKPAKGLPRIGRPSGLYVNPDVPRTSPRGSRNQWHEKGPAHRPPFHYRGCWLLSAQSVGSSSGAYTQITHAHTLIGSSVSL